MSSTMDIPALITLQDRSANAPSQVNTNFTRIRTAVNESLDTTSGHTHDGVNSRVIGSGMGDFTVQQWMIAVMMGAF